MSVSWCAISNNNSDNDNTISEISVNDISFSDYSVDDNSFNDYSVNVNSFNDYSVYDNSFNDYSVNDNSVVNNYFRDYYFTDLTLTLLTAHIAVHIYSL